MDAVYRRLARKLDSLPQGFPSTPDGVEFEILARIFSPEDPRWALRLRPYPETADRIARRWKHPLEQVRDRLERIAACNPVKGVLLKGWLAWHRRLAHPAPRSS